MRNYVDMPEHPDGLTEHVQHQSNYTCVKNDRIYDVDMYYAAIERYRAQMAEYKKLNFFKRLFAKKPVFPELNDYLYF